MGQLENAAVGAVFCLLKGRVGALALKEIGLHFQKAISFFYKNDTVALPHVIDCVLMCLGWL